MDTTHDEMCNCARCMITRMDRREQGERRSTPRGVADRRGAMRPAALAMDELAVLLG